MVKRDNGADNEILSRLERLEKQNKVIMERLPSVEGSKVPSGFWKKVDFYFSRLFHTDTLALIAIMGMGLNMLSLGLTCAQMATYGISVNSWLTNSYIYTACGILFVFVGLVGAFWLSAKRLRKSKK
ncbi:MAG: hypothetical protein WBZ29_03190 [Methanocella sp.]